MSEGHIEFAIPRFFSLFRNLRFHLTRVNKPHPAQIVISLIPEKPEKDDVDSDPIFVGEIIDDTLSAVVQFTRNY